MTLYFFPLYISIPSPSGFPFLNSPSYILLFEEINLPNPSFTPLT